MTATQVPQARAAAATDRALRRQPVKVGVAPVVNDRVAPFGDGSTMRLPAGRAISDRGESEYVAFPRGSANRACTDRA